MRLQGLEVTRGERTGRVRVRGRVRYDSDGLEEDLWFDVPASQEPHLSSTGNPWLVALLPIAVSQQESLRLELPVDEALLEGCRLLLDVWHAWYPHLVPIALEAPATRTVARPVGAGTGLFFSGGVDSFHSLIRHNDPGAASAATRVTDLLLVHGADIPIADTDAFDRLRPRMADVAGAFGIGLIDVATNMRATRCGRADWPQLAHASLLVAAGLVLESRFDRLLIASSAPYDQLRPWGSHPITDPLYSTSHTRVIHDGADLDRPEKMEMIATHPAVLKHLRICWIGRSDTNCGRCPKCLNTMIGMELAGTLTQCETLPREILPSAVRHVYFESRGTYAAYWMLRKFRQRAWMAGRLDLVRLMDQVLARSDRIRVARDVLEGLARRRLIPAGLSKALIAHLFRSSVKY